MSKGKKRSGRGKTENALALPGFEGFITGPGEDPNVKEQASTAMDRADERQIAALATGDMAPECVYSYKKGDDVVTGISFVGFRVMYEEIYKEPLPRFVEPPKIELIKDDPRGPVLVAHCVVQHPSNKNIIFPAWAEQSVFHPGDRKYPNFHARAVVAGKLLRNAIRGLIKPSQATKFLHRALKVKSRVALVSSQKEEGKGRRQSILSWIANIAKGAGLDTNKEAEMKKIRNAIANQFKTRLSDMDASQLQTVGEWLADSIDKHGKEAFIGWVNHNGTTKES